MLTQVPNTDHTVFWGVSLHGSLFNTVSTTAIFRLHHLIPHHLNNMINVQLSHLNTYEYLWKISLVLLHRQLLQIWFIILNQNPPLFCICYTISNNTQAFMCCIMIQNRGEEIKAVLFDAFPCNKTISSYIFPLISDCFPYNLKDQIHHIIPHIQQL